MVNSKVLLLDILVYTALFGFACVIIVGIHDVYMEGKIDYQYTKHPVTVNDNPAVVVEIFTDEEIQYGVNYTIEIFDWDDKNKKYIQNPNDALVYWDRTSLANASSSPGLFFNKKYA